jgi:hypothetical protein
MEKLPYHIIQLLALGRYGRTIEFLPKDIVPKQREDTSKAVLPNFR